MSVLKSWCISVTIVDMLCVGRSRVRLLAVTVIFIFFRKSTLILVPTEPPIQEILCIFPQSCCMKLTTHICLLPKVRMSRVVHLLHYMPFWHGQRQLYIELSQFVLNHCWNESTRIKEIVFWCLQ